MTDFERKLGDSHMSSVSQLETTAKAMWILEKKKRVAQVSQNISKQHERETVFLGGSLPAGGSILYLFSWHQPTGRSLQSK